MEVLIVYCSSYRQNTEKIARAFSGKAGCRLVNIKDAGSIKTEDYDIIGLGSGVYRESLSPKLFSLVENLDLDGKKAFVFSTSGVGMRFYNNKLIGLLKSKGAAVIGSFACKGSFDAKEFTDNRIFNFIGRLSQGHPDEKDIKAAERFIEKMVGHI